MNKLNYEYAVVSSLYIIHTYTSATQIVLIRLISQPPLPVSVISDMTQAPQSDVTQIYPKSHLTICEMSTVMSQEFNMCRYAIELSTDRFRECWDTFFSPVLPTTPQNPVIDDRIAGAVYCYWAIAWYILLNKFHSLCKNYSYTKPLRKSVMKSCTLFKIVLVNVFFI